MTKDVNEMTAGEFKVHENRIRRKARACGFELHKSRCKVPHAEEYGTYAISKDGRVEAERLSIDEVENWLSEPVLERHGFKVGEHVVYPSHGVGKIAAIEVLMGAGYALEWFVINFEKGETMLRVPTAELEAVGMRKLSEDSVVRRAMETLRTRATVKPMSRFQRVLECKSKINSGDLVQIAEVLRDLRHIRSRIEGPSTAEAPPYRDALRRMFDEVSAITNGPDAKTFETTWLPSDATARLIYDALDEGERAREAGRMTITEAATAAAVG